MHFSDAASHLLAPPDHEGVSVDNLDNLAGEGLVLGPDVRPGGRGVVLPQLQLVVPRVLLGQPVLLRPLGDDLQRPVDRLGEAEPKGPGMISRHFFKGFLGLCSTLCPGYSRNSQIFRVSEGISFYRFVQIGAFCAF